MPENGGYPHPSVLVLSLEIRTFAVFSPVEIRWNLNISLPTCSGVKIPVPVPPDEYGNSKGEVT